VVVAQWELVLLVSRLKLAVVWMPAIQACRLAVVRAEEEPFLLVRNNQDRSRRRSNPYQGSTRRARGW
jgi:hypothetical protein